jgi:hypothetical protein
MAIPIVEAVRSESVSPVQSRWQPVDLVCVGGAEADDGLFLVRTKLTRDRQSAAVGVSEAVGHRIFSLLGVPVAEPFQVSVGSDFAADLTGQYGFSPSVMAGTHWGTRFIKDSLESVVHPSHLSILRRPKDVLLIYFVDVLIANRDRNTNGNVLLVPVSGGRMDVIPIDQSDCFGGPDVMSSEAQMQGLARSAAAPLDGMESLVLDLGPAAVREAFDAVVRNRDEIIASVNWVPEAWYARSAVRPDSLAAVLERRLGSLEELARLDHWLGMSSMGGGNIVLL